MKYARILTIVLLFITFHLILSTLATQIISPGFFPYQDDLIKTGLPHYLYSLANFDGAQYLKIAQYGYLPLTQAFFPLYPMTIRILTMMTGIPSIHSGLMISLFSFFGILILLNKYLRLLFFKREEAYWFLSFFLVFPTSFFLITLYTESIFIFFFLGGLVAVRKNKYLIAGFCGIAIGLTRVTGIFLMIPLFMELLDQYREKNKKSKLIESIYSIMKSWKKLLILVAPLTGFVLYTVFLRQTTGDFFAFFNLQPVSNATRSTSLVLLPQVLYRYVKIFITATPNLQYFIAVVEFAIIIFVGSLIAYDFWKIAKGSKENQYTRIGLHVYSLAVLILPTLTGTLSSLPRYALPLLSTYYILAKLKNQALKWSVLLLFIILHIILYMYFVQGYFVS